MGVRTGNVLVSARNRQRSGSELILLPRFGHESYFDAPTIFKRR